MSGTDPREQGHQRIMKDRLELQTLILEKQHELNLKVAQEQHILNSEIYEKQSKLLKCVTIATILATLISAIIGAIVGASITRKSQQQIEKTKLQTQ
jgi:hypothetical protein